MPMSMNTTNLFPTDLDLDLDMSKMNMPFNGGYGATGWGEGLSYSPDVFIEDPPFDYFSMFSNNGAASNDFMNWSAGQPYSAAAPTAQATSADNCFGFQDMDYLSEGIASPGEMTDSSSSRGSSRKHSRADDSDSSAAEEPVSPRTSTRPASKKSRPSPRFGKPSTKPSKSSSSSKNSSSPASETSSKPSVGLRTAPRKVKPESKASPATPEDDLTAEEQRARQSHNLVEKKYRNRLNAQFEQLLAVLPADQQREATTSSKRGGSQDEEKRMSKGDVLDLARRRIRALEQEKARLQAERAALLETANSMRGMTSPIMA